MKEEILEYYEKNSFELRVIIFSSFFFAFVFLTLNGGFEEHPDSFDYIQGIDAVLDGQEWHDPAVAFRPGVIFFSIPFSIVINNSNSIGFHNLLIYFSFGPCFYYLCQKITKDNFHSLYSTLILISSFPIFYWGLAILNDLGSWFFILLSLIMIIRLHENNYSIKYIVFSALAVGIGVFYKTTVGYTAIFFTILLANKIQNSQYIRIVKIWFLFAFMAFIPLLINQFYIYENWGLSYFDFLYDLVETKSGNDTDIVYDDLKHSNRYKFYSLIIAFPLFPLAFIGMMYANKNLEDFNFTYLKYMFFSGSVFVILLSTGIASPRYSFILFPAFYICFSIGLNFITDYMRKNYNFKVTKIYTIIVVANFLITIALCSFDNSVREMLGFWRKN